MYLLFTPIPGESYRRPLRSLLYVFRALINSLLCWSCVLTVLLFIMRCKYKSVWVYFIAVTCHLHLWQNHRDRSRTTAVTRVWNWHRARGSTESWPWRRKLSRPFLNYTSEPWNPPSNTEGSPSSVCACVCACVHPCVCEWAWVRAGACTCVC